MLANFKVDKINKFDEAMRNDRINALAMDWFLREKETNPWQDH